MRRRFRARGHDDDLNDVVMRCHREYEGGLRWWPVINEFVFVMIGPSMGVIDA